MRSRHRRESGVQVSRALVIYMAMTLTGAVLWLVAVDMADVDGWALAALIASEALVITASRPLERHLKANKTEEEEEA